MDDAQWRKLSDTAKLEWLHSNLVQMSHRMNGLILGLNELAARVTVLEEKAQSPGEG